MLKIDREIINQRSRSEWEAMIQEWVHNEQDRAMLRRHIVDGLTIEAITNEVYPALEYTQIRRRIKAAKKQLFDHL